MSGTFISGSVWKDKLAGTIWKDKLAMRGSSAGDLGLYSWGVTIATCEQETQPAKHDSITAEQIMKKSPP